MGGVSSAGGMSQGVVADVLSALVQTGWPRRRRTIIPTVLLVPVTIVCIMIHNHTKQRRFLWTPLAAFASQLLNSKKKKKLSFLHVLSRTLSIYEISSRRYEARYVAYLTSA